MADQFTQLCLFFGITAAPSNFAELIPWLFTVLVAIGLVLSVFRFLFACMSAGRWFR